MIKITGLRIAALLAALILSGCRLPAGEPAEIEYAGLKCVVVEERNQAKIMKLFQQMQAEGAKEGYTPFIILRDEDKSGRSVLDEWLGFAEEDHGSLSEYTRQILNEYEDLDAEEYFESSAQYYLEQQQWEKGEGQLYVGDINAAVPDHELYIDYVEQIYIAKVPTVKPYEVLAYIPVGGFNDCPPTKYHLAVAKKWYEAYGAVPCAVSYDIVQYYLADPVTDDAALEELKREQYIYCYDIVDQGVGSLENLKRSLNGSSIWFFWWD